MEVSSQEENYAYIRSSGIEFWHIYLIKDVNDIRSSAVAFFIPFNPVNLKDYDSSIEKLALEINWDIKG